MKQRTHDEQMEKWFKTGSHNLPQILPRQLCGKAKLDASVTKACDKKTTSLAYSIQQW